MNAEKKKRKREKLFKEQSGKCHWCDQPMQLGPYPEGGTLPHNMATFEHLDDRLSPARGTYYRDNTIRVVLACSACNHQRGKESHATLTMQEMWKRSGRAPLAYWWPTENVSTQGDN